MARLEEEGAVNSLVTRVAEKRGEQKERKRQNRIEGI